MEILNTASPIVLGILFIIILLIYQVIRSPNTKSASIKTPWLSVERTEDNTSDIVSYQIDFFKKEIEKLRETYQKEIDSLKNTIYQLKITIKYLENKDKLKFEYRAQVNRFTKKYFIRITEKLDNLFLTNLTNAQVQDVDILQIRNLDEYRICIFLFKDIINIIIKKFMDDFDINGFTNVGKDSEGKFNQRIFNDYMASKIYEFETEIKNFLLISIDQPLTIIDYGNQIITFEKRQSFITTDSIYDITLSTIQEYKTEIQEIYEKIIHRYQSLEHEYIGTINCKEF